MSIITKLFGSYSDHQIKKLRPTLVRINDLAPKYSAMSDAEMAGMTDIFKKQLGTEETKKFFDHVFFGTAVKEK